MVGGHRSRGAAALGFERKEPVPRADVEDRASRQTLRQSQPRQPLGLRRIDTLRDNARSKIDRMPPADRIDARLELVAFHRHSQMSVRPTSVFMSWISPRRIMSRASRSSNTFASM